MNTFGLFENNFYYISQIYYFVKIIVQFNKICFNLFQYIYIYFCRQNLDSWIIHLYTIKYMVFNKYNSERELLFLKK